MSWPPSVTPGSVACASLLRAPGITPPRSATLDDTLLVKTSRMRRLTVDPVARTARAEAGVTWLQVAEAAAEHGLAGLAGSSPDVGVVGYTLGGGIELAGPQLRPGSQQRAGDRGCHGRRPAACRADACHETELFWALRGGGGSFGVVTAIELRLFPVTEVYAGLLWWPVDAASEVLEAWRELTRRETCRTSSPRASG